MERGRRRSRGRGSRRGSRRDQGSNGSPQRVRSYIQMLDSPPGNLQPIPILQPSPNLQPSPVCQERRMIRASRRGNLGCSNCRHFMVPILDNIEVFLQGRPLTKNIETLTAIYQMMTEFLAGNQMLIYYKDDALSIVPESDALRLQLIDCKPIAHHLINIIIKGRNLKIRININFNYLGKILAQFRHDHSQYNSIVFYVDLEVTIIDHIPFGKHFLPHIVLRFYKQTFVGDYIDVPLKPLERIALMNMLITGEESDEEYLSIYYTPYPYFRPVNYNTGLMVKLHKCFIPKFIENLKEKMSKVAHTRTINFVVTDVINGETARVQEVNLLEYAEEDLIPVENDTVDTN